MVAKKLSTWHKVHYLPIILERDGTDCFYCEEAFPPLMVQKVKRSRERVFDHLNNDPKDNRAENLCIAHRECNEKKKWRNEWIVKAKRKLRENEQYSQMHAKSHANTDKETGTEMDSNAIFSEICLNYLGEMLEPHGDAAPVEAELDYKTTLDLLTAKGFKRCGHASQNTFRRIIDMLTAGEHNFTKMKNEDHRWVIRYNSEKDLI